MAGESVDPSARAPLALLYDATFLDHYSWGHPESPERLRAITAAMGREPRIRSEWWRSSPPADEADLALVHKEQHIRSVQQFAGQGGGWLDSDTYCNPGSYEIALQAAGAAKAAVQLACSASATPAFALVRPPGHHATPDRAMGFCLFNNAAIAAQQARARWGVRRVAVVDFDVHHGNGTEAAFAADPELFYASSHQYPCYPGTGAARGIADHIVNIPLPPGSDGGDFRAAWETTILPALDAFAPELLIVSAGFDAHHADPLAELRLTERDFAWVSERLVACADTHAGGRIVSVLEGGYNLDALAASAAAHVRALMKI